MVDNVAGQYLSCKGRVFVIDNFFNSRKLGKDLLQKETHVLGTIRSNSLGVPNEIKKQLEVFRLCVPNFFLARSMLLFV